MPARTVCRTKEVTKKMEMETRSTWEREFDFVLILTRMTALTREAEDALFEAGCDDATICVRYGAVYLNFARTAPTLKHAILSAIRDVRKANIGAEVRRVGVCDFTQAEIARRIDRSRQAVHQYITGERGPGGFPAPVCYIAAGPLWFWCEVAQWLWQNDMITDQERRDALFLALINDVLDLRYKRQFDLESMDEILHLVDSL
jgi:hypothetical protein